MLFVSVLFFVVLTISSCGAQTFLCHYYTEQSKSLEIYCDHYRNQLPKNCERELPSTDPLQVINLKIEGCKQSAIAEASEKYPNICGLEISHSGYRSLDWTGKAFENVVRLDVSFNELNAIPTSIFSKFPKLQQLYLANNKLTKIINDDFVDGGHRLKDLILTHNMLTTIDDDAFANLSELSRIELSNNQFATIPKALSKSSVQEIIMLENPQIATINCTFIEAIGSKHVYFTWKYITTFDGGQNCSKWKFIADKNAMDGIFPNYMGRTKLFCNRTQQLETCFQHIQTFVAGSEAFENLNEMLNLLGPSVVKIDLSNNNRLDNLSDRSFGKFSNLRELSLHNCGLKTFDFNTLKNQKKLKHLRISANNLEVISNPRSLQNFEFLTSFDAAENRIQNAVEIVRYFPSSVQHLNLSGNDLSTVNAFNDFQRLTALTHLNLSDTNLTISTVDPFESVRHLISLDISHNNLSNCSFSTLDTLNRLREFRAAHSQIGNISETIEHLWPTSIEKLDLSGNLASKSDLNSINRLKNLKKLNLSDIGIEQIDSNSFEALSSLTHLDISNNNDLEEIDVKRFPKSLQQLNLHGNNLQKIEHLDREHFPALKVLSLNKNQLDCDNLNELKSQFSDDDIIGAECEHNDKFSKILMAVLIVLLIGFNIITLYFMPDICK